MKKTLVALSLFLTISTNNAKATKIIKENIYQYGTFEYSVSDDSHALKLNIKENNNIDFYFLNIRSGNGKNFYAEIIYDKGGIFEIPFKDVGAVEVEVNAKNLNNHYYTLGIIELNVTDNNWLDNTYLIPKNHEFVRQLLSKEFKGYKNWTNGTKASRVHKYIINNFRYDYDFSSKIRSGEVTHYNPSLDKLWNERKGLCYDFASLYASILRAMNVPTKLEVGYVTLLNGGKEYHAWNSIEVNGEWEIIDTTFDLGTVSAMEYKDNSKYKVDYAY